MHLLITFSVIDQEDSKFNAVWEKYKKFGEIKFKAVKCLFIGPPQVGKTSTKLHLGLLDEIEKLRSHKSSTGIEPPIETTYINIEGNSCTSAWKRLGLIDMASVLISRIASEKEVHVSVHVQESDGAGSSSYKRGLI